MNIPSVPDSITREHLATLIRGCGFDPEELLSFQITHDAVTVVVPAYGPDHLRVIDGHELARHVITVPIVDVSRG